MEAVSEPLPRIVGGLPRYEVATSEEEQMSDVMTALRNSDDALERDLAGVLDHWQAVKRSNNQPASLGYEPRDIKRHGAVSVISGRVLKASAGFEEVDPEQSYEALVLRHPQRFEDDVIAAARRRLTLGASKLKQFQRQDIQFFVKSSSIELFGEKGVVTSVESWIRREVQLPKLLEEDMYAEPSLEQGFLGFVWLHEQESEGERGRGLTGIAEFGPQQLNGRTRILDLIFFDAPVGRDLLEAHKNDGTFVSSVNDYRHSRTWPISDFDVDTLLSAVRDKTHKLAEYAAQTPDPNAVQNLQLIEEATVLCEVVLRRYQSAFRKKLLDRRAKRCAITGTSEPSVLEAAHIIPYASKFADRDKLENGILLRSDIHKLFDAHLISINPATRRVVVSDRVGSLDYLSLRGVTVPDEVSQKSLEFHFQKFQK